MTNDQIKFILNEQDVIEDTWLDLSDKFPLICLRQGVWVYVNKNARYRFNSTKSLLEIVFGKISDGIFTSNSGATDNFVPDSFVSYDIIYGLYRSVGAGPKGSYFSIV